MKKKKCKSKNRVVQILMNRDDLTEFEALDLINQCRESLENGNYDAIYEYLGLEDDYIFDIIDF